jgi:hypothetical protein
MCLRLFEYRINSVNIYVPVWRTLLIKPSKTKTGVSCSCLNTDSRENTERNCCSDDLPFLVQLRKLYSRRLCLPFNRFSIIFQYKYNIFLLCPYACVPLLLQCSMSIMPLISRRSGRFTKHVGRILNYCIISERLHTFFIAFFFPNLYLSDLHISFHNPDTLIEMYNLDGINSLFLLVLFDIQVSSGASSHA